MEEILDYNQPEPGPKQGKKYRPFALLVELVPFFLGLIGIIFSVNALTIISWTSLAMIYFALSWYLFKGVKFEIGAIVYAIFSGITLSVLLLGTLFGVMRWEGAYEMIIVAFAGTLPMIVVSIIWYFMRRKKYFEYTLSLKVLSRLILGVLLMFVISSFFS